MAKAETSNVPPSATTPANSATPATPPAADPATSAARPSPATVAIKPGDVVNVVLASGKPTAAKVKSTRTSGRVDLTFDHLGETVTITSSPFDATGKTPDSWHRLAED